MFSHPYISFFRLLVNGFSVIREYGSTLYVGLARAISPTNTNFRLTFLLIREYGSTLYVGLARAVSPTNTNFRLTFLLTRLQEALYEDLAV